MAKPSIPQGTRDFGPETVRKRNYIFQTIRNIFELYGFQPLETPAMENLDTLMGKYGEEGDKLIYRILDSGNPFSPDFLNELVAVFTQLQKYLKDLDEMVNDLKKHKAFANTENPYEKPIWQLSAEYLAFNINEIITDDESAYKNLLLLRNEISDKALKYDLTIPFARYVAMNHGRLTFPFKRYQIQPVWRADRPQKGRYREFYQCDADVVGSHSLMNEVEFAMMYSEVFTRLNIEVDIKINNRKILWALAHRCGSEDMMVEIAMIIDKLHKIGLEKVRDELAGIGLNAGQVFYIEMFLSIAGNNEEKLSMLKEILGDIEIAKKGIEEIEFILNQSQLSSSSNQLVVDLTLARGLNYYTGAIFEVAAKNVKMGSIGGGGRYDDLTGLFGVPGIPGVGISFGVDRIYDVMEELKLFPEKIYSGTKVLFFNLGEKESHAAFDLMQHLRGTGISAELYHENSKMDKQFKYAEKKNIPYAVIIGSREMEEKTCVVKDLRNGEQQVLSVEELIKSFRFE